jgi:D-serine deaminase-like pyridoxal phosphate-dependent protein
VISDAVPGQVIVDAGSKTFTSDSHDDGAHGIVVGLPGAILRDINEEHGYLDVSTLERRPRIGDRLRIVPNHACGCVNLHDGLLGVRDGVAERVLPVGGRGLIR